MLNDSEYTDVNGYIVCPHCGHKHEDADFLIDDYFCGDETCDECGYEYTFTCELCASWSTVKKDK